MLEKYRIWMETYPSPQFSQQKLKFGNNSQKVRTADKKIY